MHLVAKVPPKPTDGLTHLDVDAVELIEAGPCTALSQTAEELACRGRGCGEGQEEGEGRESREGEAGWAGG